jgi:formylglycine-generating enzyme required for sulfatase activity
MRNENASASLASISEVHELTELTLAAAAAAICKGDITSESERRHPIRAGAQAFGREEDRSIWVRAGELRLERLRQPIRAIAPRRRLWRSRREQPRHRVVFAKPLAVGRFEVTFSDWDACVAYGECARVTDGGYGRGRQPVINVTWDQARQYAAWLSRMTGKPYRLLSEASSNTRRAPER